MVSGPVTLVPVCVATQTTASAPLPPTGTRLPDQVPANDNAGVGAGVGVGVGAGVAVGLGVVGVEDPLPHAVTKTSAVSAIVSVRCDRVMAAKAAGRDFFMRRRMPVRAIQLNRQIPAFGRTWGKIGAR